MAEIVHRVTIPEIVTLHSMLHKENCILLLFYFRKIARKNGIVGPLLSTTALRAIMWYNYQSFPASWLSNIEVNRDNLFLSLTFLLTDQPRFIFLRNLLAAPGKLRENFQRLLHAISRNVTACVRAFRRLNNITATAKQIEDEMSQE